MDFTVIADALLHYGLPLLGSSLAGLVVWVLKQKLHLQITAEQEKLLADVLAKAVAFAEEWGHKQMKAAEAGKGPPPTGTEKLAQATAFVKKEVARVGIKLDDKQIDALLHSAIGMIRQ
jgi:hypothetical protein